MRSGNQRTARLAQNKQQAAVEDAKGDADATPTWEEVPNGLS